MHYLLPLTRIQCKKIFPSVNFGGREYIFESDYVYLFHTMVFDDEELGTVCIVYGLGEMQSRLIQYAITVVAVLLVAGTVAFFITFWIPKADYRTHSQSGGGSKYCYEQERLFNPGKGS